MRIELNLKQQATVKEITSAMAQLEQRLRDYLRCAVEASDDSDGRWNLTPDLTALERQEDVKP